MNIATRPQGILLLAALLLLAAPACGDDEEPPPQSTAEPDGMALYDSPLEGGNAFACATCHALSEPTPDGIIRPGHPIGDATRRPSWKNGQLSSVREAVNVCVEYWMNAEPFVEGDPEWQALYTFLDSQASAESASAVTMQRVDPPPDLMGGNPDDGRALFNTRCVVCHGVNGVGTARAPRVAGLELEPTYIANRVRTSGSADAPVYDGLTGGIMPFWGADRLSDNELIDIVAWVSGSVIETECSNGADDDDDGAADCDDPDCGTSPDCAAETETSCGDAIDDDADGLTDCDDPDCDGDPLCDGSGCGTSHERVGWTMAFTGHFHDVAGTATMVDECTIRIDDFVYDGEGVDVQIYGAEGGAWATGVSLSGDLRRAGGYDGETLTLALPDGVTLDEIDGLSVWCVPVGVSFGDGEFGP